MNEKLPYDWDPRCERVLKDQIAAYDEMRHRCPVAHSEYLQWSLFRHEDVMRVLNDHDTFSSAVSSHLSVPNGMDPPEHTAYRHIIELYFSPQRMDAFEPVCRDVAVNLVRKLSAEGDTVQMTTFAEDFALQIQCVFLGWPADLYEPLRQWVRKNREATLAKDKTDMDEVAFQFDGYIKALLSERLEAGMNAPDDITSSLLRARIGNRPLGENEIVSILRNWTVGELGTMAACVGILAHYLAKQPALQQQLREHPSQLPAAIDEILRLHPPLIANRRLITKAVEIGEHKLPKGERLTLMWASANRDEAVFGDPDEFRLDRDSAVNLLYGAGIHVCPGAPLARLELRIVMEELLQRSKLIALVPDQKPLKDMYPASGFSSLPLRFQWPQTEAIEPHS